MAPRISSCRLSGIAKGELIGDRRKHYQDALRVRHADLSTRTIRLKETKNGDDRVVPMTQEVYALMAACVSGKANDDFLSTRKDGKQVKDFRVVGRSCSKTLESLRKN